MKIDTVRILGDVKATGTIIKPCASISVDGSSKKFGSEFVMLTNTEGVSEIIVGPGLDISVASNFELHWMECEVRCCVRVACLWILISTPLSCCSPTSEQRQR